MVYPFRYILLVGTIAFGCWLGSPASLRAQGTREAAARTAGTVANVFETLDPNRPLDALRVTLPERWTLKRMELLRYGTDPVPVRVQRTSDPRTHLFTVGSPLRGPHDVLLRVQLPDVPGTFAWTLQTLVRESTTPDSVKQPRFRVVERHRHELNVKTAPRPDQSNRALFLGEATEPLLLPSDALPPLGQGSSFTIEFWMRTNGLDETVLSTWNGNESVSYPAEFVVDRGGRLRYYIGEPGRHRALRSGEPVADDTWHHVAAIYDAQRARLRLLLDGRRVDSLRGQSVPSAPRPVPVAVGGRVREGAGADQQAQSLFSGHLDELRIWGDARSIEAVRRMKNRPFQPAVGDDGEQRLVRLGFDEETDPALTQRWPEGAQRVPATLSFQSSLRNLRARTDGRTVTLEWTAEASNVRAFIVERSKNGQAFTKIAELPPSEARRASVSDLPEFAYTDEDVAGQVVFYRIRLARAEGRERTSGTIKIGLGPKAEEQAPVKLIGNFPNPFTETTTVAYEVNEPLPITITVWDLQGHKIAQLADGEKGTGYHETPFEASDLPSGTYFLKLETPSETQTHPMVVLK